MASRDFILKRIDETRSYLLEETKHNDLMIEKYKKVCRALNYFEHYLIFVFAIYGCLCISAFASLVGIPIGITVIGISSAVRLNVWAVTIGIKRYKSIVKKKRRNHDEIVLQGKFTLETIKVLISETLLDAYINHDKFVSVYYVLTEYNEMKEKNKKTMENENEKLLCQLLEKYCKRKF